MIKFCLVCRNFRCQIKGICFVRLHFTVISINVNKSRENLLYSLITVLDAYICVRVTTFYYFNFSAYWIIHKANVMTKQYKGKLPMFPEAMLLIWKERILKWTLFGLRWDILIGFPLKAPKWKRIVVLVTSETFTI